MGTRRCLETSCANQSPNDAEPHPRKTKETIKQSLKQFRISTPQFLFNISIILVHIAYISIKAKGLQVYFMYQVELLVVTNEMWLM